MRGRPLSPPRPVSLAASVVTAPGPAAPPVITSLPPSHTAQRGVLAMSERRNRGTWQTQGIETMATDKVLAAFLRTQEAEGLALAAASDLLGVVPLGASPAARYLVRYACRCLVLSAAGAVEEADHFVVGIELPDDYLRRVEPMRVVSWLEPRNVFHPNISDVAPVICVGRLAPGTPLVDILYQVFEIGTYRKATVREDDALNRRACAWARRNQHRFPVDDRPLKRRPVQLRLAPSEEGAR